MHRQKRRWDIFRESFILTTTPEYPSGLAFQVFTRGLIHFHLLVLGLVSLSNHRIDVGCEFFEIGPPMARIPHVTSAVDEHIERNRH